MSIRYERVTVRLEYTEDFSPTGDRPFEFSFVVTDENLDRVRTLLKWREDDLRGSYADVFIGM